MKQDLTFTKPLIRGIKNMISKLPQLAELIGEEKLNNLWNLSNEEVMNINIKLQRESEKINPTPNFSSGGDVIGLMIEMSKDRKNTGVII